MKVGSPTPVAVKVAGEPEQTFTDVGDMETVGLAELMPVILAVAAVIAPVADSVCVLVFTALPVTFIQGSALGYSPNTMLPSVPVTSDAL